MTNLIPIEALNHFLEGDYTEEQKKKVKRILNAQINYEIRDLCLSIFANNPLISKNNIYKKNNKRYFKCKNIEYSFKQSSPKTLVNGYYGNLALPKIIYNYIMDTNTKMFDAVVYCLCFIIEKYDTEADFFGFLFFCNKEYTKQTGIEPHVVESYDELVEKYINYLLWKIGE